jgi:hypothetical protein
MLVRGLPGVVLLLSLVIVLVRPAPARAELEADLALVLAVDVSRSMDSDEQQLQRDGFVEAFRSQAVHEAVRKGVLGRVAVTYIEWSGPAEQNVVVPWTVIDGPAGTAAFAERLASIPVQRVFSTSISGPSTSGLSFWPRAAWSRFVA